MMVMAEQGMSRVSGKVVVVFRRQATQLVPADFIPGGGGCPGDQHIGQYRGGPAGADQA
jgi:hypothetical protein